MILLSADQLSDNEHYWDSTEPRRGVDGMFCVKCGRGWPEAQETEECAGVALDGDSVDGRPVDARPTMSPA